MTTFGVWLNAAHAAEYLDFGVTPQAVKNFREWVRRHGVPTAHRGRTVLFARADLDRMIGATTNRRSGERTAAPSRTETGARA